MDPERLKGNLDLIVAYLDELRAGLRMPPGQAELIVAEAEDHLCETAAAGMAVGMTELEAQQAAISSFGPVRAVARAHRHRGGVAGKAAMAGWNLVAVLAITVGAGGLVNVGIIVRSLDPPPGAQLAGLGPAGRAELYGAVMAGGVIALAGYRLIRRRSRRPHAGSRPPGPLASLVSAAFFLIVAALLFVLNVTGVVIQETMFGPTFSGSATWAGGGWAGGWMQPELVHLIDPDTVVAGCLAVAVGFGAQAALRRARTRPGSGARALRPGRADRGRVVPPHAWPSS
jgi:hypothetical protein